MNDLIDFLNLKINKYEENFGELSESEKIELKKMYLNKYGCFSVIHDLSNNEIELIFRGVVNE